MSVFNEHASQEHEAYLMEYRKRVYSQFEKLLASKTSLASIADLLNAQEFLTSEDQGSKREPVYRFDVRGFVDREVKKRDPLLLPFDFDTTSDVIVPPDSSERQALAAGDGSFEKKGVVPRTQYLVEVLSELHQPYAVVDGKNTSEMMRGESYKVFLLPESGKIVMVNDEEGNATFVVHGLNDVMSEWEPYAERTKEQLKSAETVSVIIFSSAEAWKDKIKEALVTDKPGNLKHRLTESNEADEVFARDIKKEREKTPQAPEGWANLNMCVILVGKSPELVQAIAKSYRETNPEWFQSYASRMSGRVSEHFHPDLVAKIKETIEQLPPVASEGWVTAYKYAHGVGKDITFVQAIAQPYRETNPEWFQKFQWKEGGMAAEHLHPDLVAKIKETIEQLPPVAPEGWMHLYELSKVLGETRTLIQPLVEQYRDKHPEWFEKYTTRKTSRITEHFHPDLVAKIREEVESRPSQPPEGWMSAKRCSRMLGIGGKHTRKIVEKYRNEHPDWFHTYSSNRGGRVGEYFHPDLVARIREEVESRPPQAPEGWLSATGCVERFSKHWTTITVAAEKYREEHPEWFQNFLAEKNLNVVEHFHPNLIKKLQEIFEIQSPLAPEGWMTVTQCFEFFGEGLNLVKSEIEKYRESHPQWIKLYTSRVGGQIVEHYHPDLIAKIKETLNSRPPVVPDGWMNLFESSNLIGRSRNFLQPIVEHYRTTHPAWFHMYRSKKSGAAFEYFHPELIKRIQEDIEKQQ